MYALLAEMLLGTRVVTVTLAVIGVVFYRSLAIVVFSQVAFALLICLAALPVVFGPLHRVSARSHIMQVSRYALSLGLAGIVSAVASNADIIVVGAYLSSGALSVYNTTVATPSVLGAFFVTLLVTALFVESSLRSESNEELRLGARPAIRFTNRKILRRMIHGTPFNFPNLHSSPDARRPTERPRSLLVEKRRS
ncbi:MAG: oligosaccharide flippase family protein [Nitrososphaerota archaeon]|jgi:O-antigen/teichoic acid export membrane protein|nr:oligosaccharide flippase family protein [Nitrososphaerota archaeon]MDG6971712.1 oligosaccharide flippase family protein [Nitrososphaerota archaeon]MDG7014934.1 oligosaccharide flippase family protein [Nitrososphaerota archaeon]WGO50892.1 MAG: oligosaccharide flippase family protein [Nitrososphaerota archaeon]